MTFSDAALSSLARLKAGFPCVDAILSGKKLVAERDKDPRPIWGIKVCDQALTGTNAPAIDKMVATVATNPVE